MRLFLTGACCLCAMASVCRAELTYQGISRGVFGLTDNHNDRFIGSGSVGLAAGQQDSFITPSVAWVYSSVANDLLPGFNSRCQFYLTVPQPTDALLMLVGNSDAVSGYQVGPPPSSTSLLFPSMQPYSYKVLHLDPAVNYYSFSVMNEASALSFTSLTIADLSLPQSTLRGDLDRNGLLDTGDTYAMILALSDIPAYKSAWRMSPADFLSIADVDQSGSVSSADLQALRSLMGTSTIVPEPGTLALAGVGAALLMARSLVRRKSRSQK